MSYDLYVFPRRPGEDPDDTYEALMEAQEADEELADAEDVTGRWDDYGVQIEVYEDGSAAVALAYWHDGGAAREALAAVREGVDSLRGRLGDDLVVYDPQLGRAVDLDRDLDEMLPTYARGHAVVAELTNDEQGGRRRKRFFGLF